MCLGPCGPCTSLYSYPLGLACKRSQLSLTWYQARVSSLSPLQPPPSYPTLQPPPPRQGKPPLPLLLSRGRAGLLLRAGVHDRRASRRAGPPPRRSPLQPARRPPPRRSSRRAGPSVAPVRAPAPPALACAPCSLPAAPLPRPKPGARVDRRPATHNAQDRPKTPTSAPCSHGCRVPSPLFLGTGRILWQSRCRPSCRCCCAQAAVGGRAHRRRWVPHRDGPRIGPCGCGGCASRGGCRSGGPSPANPPVAGRRSTPYRRSAASSSTGRPPGIPRRRPDCCPCRARDATGPFVGSRSPVGARA
jgi:hypothetical protein